jgi:hypothetical protein
MPSPTICVGTARHCLTGALAIHPQAGWSELYKELSGLALAVGAGLGVNLENLTIGVKHFVEKT